MTTRTFVVAASAVLTAAASAGVVYAQARSTNRTAAPAAAPPAASAATARPAGASAITGQPLTGVCIFSNRGAVAGSAVGKAIDARMDQLQKQAAAELSGERAAIETDAKAFEAKRASLTAEQQQQQAQPINARVQAFQQKAQQREAELRQKLGKQVDAVEQRITPIVTTISASRNCSLVLNGDGAVMAANPQMDLTPAVVQQLNAQITTVTFDRENLTNQAAAAPARR